MPSSKVALAIADIIEHAELALDFVSGISLRKFKTDKKTYLAVARCVEIISEASRRLPDALKAAYPLIAWKDIAGAGNIYRHNYDRVDIETVLSTVEDDLPALVAVMRDAQKREW
jgi:uncharacterized protein with HEPN domain